MNRIINRMKKMAENEEEMSFEEIKEETIQCFKNMKDRVNEWCIRDTLCKLTKNGLYNGEQMAIVDKETAKEICDQFIEIVKSIPKYRKENLYDINEKVMHWAR